ncbi:hypothetical protein CVV38_02995 [Candidatus Peregrinibacteria bacterium HGW-Peregrinibacteria-1]|jgi:UDP-N-acetylmuramate--alanine ligase|nr:MAG: hypothetical protein CVV38_02995 [Candidatus Peregrinibacteria bacterium HGW-Peregrinibacteria-1]
MFPQNIHFIGIGGIGVSAIAKMLKEQGVIISGSDTTKSAITEEIEQQGVPITYSHKSTNILDAHEMVIYSPAVPPENPELQEAQKRNIPTLSYPQALGKLTESHFTVAIAGTHGKSTTTAMLSLIAIQAQLEPNIIIGTKIREIGNQNYKTGESNLLIIEACEYKESFQYLQPDILAITNIEPDHLDYYQTAENYYRAFKKIMIRTAETGKIFLSPNQKLPKELSDLEKIIQQAPIIDNELAIPGEFNRHNASLAAAVALKLGATTEDIATTLKQYNGSWRRMEYHDEIFPGTTLIDDYGHHPTEITATINAIRQRHPEGELLLVFQPHQYSRTHHFLEEFAEALSAAPVSKIIIPNIYEVRDSQSSINSVSAQTLVDKINQKGGQAEYGGPLEQTAQHLINNHQNYQTIVTMGAGDIENIYHLLKDSSK